jgi:hypothetical protein
VCDVFGSSDDFEDRLGGDDSSEGCTTPHTIHFVIIRCAIALLAKRSPFDSVEFAHLAVLVLVHLSLSFSLDTVHPHRFATAATSINHSSFELLQSDRLVCGSGGSK